MALDERRISCESCLGQVAHRVHSAARVAGWTGAAEASCVGPALRVSAGVVAPGGSIRGSGTGFEPDCNDTGQSGPPLGAPVRKIEVAFVQADSRVVLGSVNADREYRADFSASIPVSAKPGPASLQVGPAMVAVWIDGPAVAPMVRCRRRSRSRRCRPAGRPPSTAAYRWVPSQFSARSPEPAQSSPFERYGAGTRCRASEWRLGHLRGVPQACDYPAGNRYPNAFCGTLLGVACEGRARPSRRLGGLGVGPALYCPRNHRMGGSGASQRVRSTSFDRRSISCWRILGSATTRGRRRTVHALPTRQASRRSCSRRIELPERQVGSVHDVRLGSLDAPIRAGLRARGL